MRRLLSESEPSVYVPLKTNRGASKAKPEWDNKRSQPLHNISNIPQKQSTTKIQGEAGTPSKEGSIGKGAPGYQDTENDPFKEKSK